MSDPISRACGATERTGVANLGALLGGVLQALSSSPLEGDLWLVAARLRRRLSGFDEEVERYLQASFRYTREMTYSGDRSASSSLLRLRWFSRPKR